MSRLIVIFVFCLFVLVRCEVPERTFTERLRTSDACAAFEKWLGRTFGPVDERALRNHLPFGIVSPGTLHADWTTGVFYRKRAVLSRDEDIGRWIGAPFERMTFEKGRLLSTDTLPTLPFTEEERIGRDRKMKKLLKRIEKRMSETTRSPFGEIRRDAPKAGRDRFDVSSITPKTERL